MHFVFACLYCLGVMFRIILWVFVTNLASVLYTCIFIYIHTYTHTYVTKVMSSIFLSCTADVVIISRETYPSFRHIPEGRWSVYNVTLPNRPYHNVTITFHPLTPTITLSHVEMTFEPDNWDVPQILTVYATEDDTNIISPYMASFNMSLTSLDENYDGAEIDDFNVTVEDNDDGETANIIPPLLYIQLHEFACVHYDCPNNFDCNSMTIHTFQTRLF